MSILILHTGETGAVSIAASVRVRVCSRQKMKSSRSDLSLVVNDRSDHIRLASCLIYARALVIFILWVRSVSKMLPSVKFAEDKVLTFLILREKC